MSKHGDWRREVWFRVFWLPPGLDGGPGQWFADFRERGTDEDAPELGSGVGLSPEDALRTAMGNAIGRYLLPPMLAKD